MSSIIKWNIIIFFFSFFLFSCYEIRVDPTIDTAILDLGYDIIKNPEKLRDIKKNYPEFTNENFLSLGMSDSVNINETIDWVNEYLKDRRVFFHDRHLSNNAKKEDKKIFEFLRNIPDSCIYNYDIYVYVGKSDFLKGITLGIIKTKDSFLLFEVYIVTCNSPRPRPYLFW